MPSLGVGEGIPVMGNVNYGCEHADDDGSIVLSVTRYGGDDMD